MKNNNITILYVEDERNARELLSGFIQRFCETLHVVKNGAEGLAFYKEHKVDLVISDIRMPKFSGLEMVEEMKKINKNQLVIFTTAHIDSDYLFKAMELQVDGYVAKPVDLEKLKVQIEKCLVELRAKDTLKKLQESEERARVILETSQLGVFIYKEKFIYVNAIFAQMVGYTKEELYEIAVLDLIAEENQGLIRQIVLRRLKGEKFPHIYRDLALICKDGSSITCRVRTETIHYQGEYAGLGTVLDITDILYTQKRLKLLAQAMEQMDEMVRITDEKGYIVYVNEAFIKHSGYKKSELIGKRNSLLKSGEHDDAFYKKMYAFIQKKKSFQAVFINAKKNGEHYYEDQTITPIVNEDSDEIEYFVSTSKDITEQEKMKEKMKVLATYDTLTGIKNRYSLNQEINNEIKRARRYNGSFVLLMLDIDFFKKVNDTYGHDVGDYVLKEFSNIVSQSIRDTDVFGRWGGEEFIVLAPNDDEKGAIALAEKIRKNVEAFEFKGIKHITVSIGMTLCNNYAKKELLLKQVDDALYEAKNSGRNRVVYHKCPCSDNS